MADEWDGIDDGELLRRTAQGDLASRSAFQALYRRHFPELLQHARGKLRLKTEAAEDLVQDFFAEVMAEPQKHAGVENFAAFARTVLERKAIDRFRKKRERRMADEFDAPSAAPGTITSVHFRDLKERLREAVDALTPRDRELLVERIWADASAEELGRRLRLDPRTIQREIARLVDELVSLMGIRRESLGRP